jgi:hypothetical protein
LVNINQTNKNLLQSDRFSRNPADHKKRVMKQTDFLLA